MGGPNQTIARPAGSLAGVFSITLLGFLAIGASLPVLPRFVQGPIGAGDVAVGAVVGAYAFTAVVGRPVAGRVADRRGRRVVMIAGLLLLGAGGMLYLLPANITGLVLARLVVGLGDGILYTAAALWVVDLAPEDRRGQAIGLFGIAIWGGLTIGALAGEALRSISYDAVWAFCAVLPLLGALAATRLTEPRDLSGARPPSPGRLIPAEAVRPGLALAIGQLGYVALSAFAILHLEARDVPHAAAVFIAFSGAVVVGRILLGWIPDRLGGRRAAMGAGGLEAIGLVVIALAHSLPVAVAGAIVVGVAFSQLFPALALLVIERVPEDRRGPAIGTFTAFFDGGVGLGGIAAGAIAAGAGYPAVFWVAAACAIAPAIAVAGRHARAAR